MACPIPQGDMHNNGNDRVRAVDWLWIVGEGGVEHVDDVAELRDEFFAAKLVVLHFTQHVS